MANGTTNDQRKLRRSTLIAERSLRDGHSIHTFDIRIQGENDTVCFDI